MIELQTSEKIKPELTFRNTFRETSSFFSIK